MIEQSSSDSQSLSNNHNYRYSSSPARAVFASTPAEFHLFPKHTPRKRETSPYVDPTPPPSQPDRHAFSDLTQLRSDAFGELHKSVAENGEGLVRRMRDFENSRSRSELFSKANEARKRGRERRSLRNRFTTVLNHSSGPDEDEDEDVIFAGETQATG